MLDSAKDLALNLLKFYSETKEENIKRAKKYYLGNKIEFDNIKYLDKKSFDSFFSAYSSEYTEYSSVMRKVYLFKNFIHTASDELCSAIGKIDGDKNFDVEEKHQKIANNIKDFIKNEVRQEKNAFSRYLILCHLDTLKNISSSLEKEHHREKNKNNSPYIAPQILSRMTDGLLGAIGKNDVDGKQIGDIYITRGEIAYSISDENNHYTADFINLLLYSADEDALPIKTYPAITVEKLKEYLQSIKTQTQDYAFIPLIVAYDKNEPLRINHWTGLIIDKKHQLIFYLDPAKKADISEQMAKTEDLKNILNYHNPIILNPLDFQQKEKQVGWLRHCGVYVIEIFKIFQKSIQQGNCISGSELPNTDLIKESISLQTCLSEISCGDVETISQTRKKHIEEACNTLGVDLTKLSEIQNTPPKSSESFGSYFRHTTNKQDDEKQIQDTDKNTSRIGSKSIR